MTESNITKEHEGKHGVLTLGDIQRNEGKITAVGTQYFDFRMDKVEGANGFCLLDGWQFTPDPDPLPTKPGWYVCTSAKRYGFPTLYTLSSGGFWCSHAHSSVIKLEDMAQIHTEDPLVRVSFGVAS